MIYYGRFCLILALLSIFSTACRTDTQEHKDREAVERQQEQYAKSQPLPTFDWSLERHLVIELYKIRNQNVVTHAVWRSDYGMVEGDCPSMGYGLPYDISLTNPLMVSGYRHGSVTSIGQAEPNGVFASTNTAATWVMCTTKDGQVAPVYVESKVTVYPWPVSVDYSNNRVKRAGEAQVKMRTSPE